ncbi:MAG: phosphoheptose isomerase [Candidatus Cloacimonadota bacterium]|nr:MAG: phosphoheptose isomerase [Candidatus Cloacimonadota bacterium]PIE77985.1 MAG: phosphoheptose isomerase [Candidatus Delongbacteria bacterium]
MINKKIKESFLEGQKILKNFIDNDNNFIMIESVCKKIVQSLESGGKVIICGNGGSMSDATHFAEEFSGRFRSDRAAMAAMAISDPSHITCVANDFGFDYIFSRGVEAFGREGDIFIGLSTSGNSPNIIKGFEKAESMGLETVLFLGKDGGKLKGRSRFQFIIDGKTSDRIQEIHMFILHTIVEGVERIKFPKNYNCQ